MSAHNSGRVAGLRRATVVAVTIVAGAGTAVLVSVAIARTLTLTVARDVSVTNAKTQLTTHENIVANSSGLAVYTLSGDSKAHPKCTKANGCFAFWPPSASRRCAS